MNNTVEEQTPDKAENEIMVSGKTKILGAIEHVAKIIGTNETLKFSALGTGIDKMLLIVEIVKVKYEGN